MKQINKTDKKKNQKGGQYIPTYVLSSNDWHNKATNPIPLATDISVGYNEYIFGRTTPTNDFVVSTGLSEGKYGLEMTMPSGFSGSCGTKMMGGSKQKNRGSMILQKDRRSMILQKDRRSMILQKDKKNMIEKDIKKEKSKKKIIIDKEQSKLMNDRIKNKIMHEKELYKKKMEKEKNKMMKKIKMIRDKENKELKKNSKKTKK